jgi:outer membrane protein insertion porin family
MRKSFLLLILMLGMIPVIQGQNADSTFFSVYYGSPRKLTIAGIDIAGIRFLDREVLVQLSGLSVGQEIDVPGDAVTSAIKKLWQQGLFSDVKISATKIAVDQVWLEIFLQERPRLGEVNYSGISKSEKDDIIEKVLLLKGGQVTDNQINNAQRLIKNIFLEKGFLNTDVTIVQRDDTTLVNTIILDIKVDKKEKVKIQNIVLHGNKDVSSYALERAMKKTNQKKLTNFFRTKKYLADKFKEDKVNLVKKYNEKGYRDAVITRDSVYTAKEKNRVNIDLWLEEGDKYFFRDIKWVGNTVYPSNYLDAVLGIKKGDVFDQKLLNKRLLEDEDAVVNIAYQDNGYLFSQINPTEVNIEKDSIDLEMRIYEGKQASINKIGIVGNTKTHEHVARRELYTLPGDLYSKNNIIRSIRELAQLGHFDPEAITPDVVPHPEEGTVDINYKLEEKANDQIELSGGWGAGMFVGSVGLKFANFSARNIFNKTAWRPLPSGDGQTMSLRYQTSGQYYKTASLSFFEPWLGGKKPNSFSVSFSYSRVNFSANKYYQNYYNNPSYGGGYGGYGGGYGGYGGGYGGYSPYGYGGYGGYSPYGYGGYGGYGNYGGYNTYQYNYQQEDTNKADDEIWETIAVSLGYGYRLSWPDDYFSITHELSFEHYYLQNMASYFAFMADASGNVNGTSNNLSFKTTVSRNSVDNPLYSRKGSSFSLSVKFTPPYSLLSDTDWGSAKVSNADRYRWIEYHKWLFKGQTFNVLSRNNNLVLRSAFELGFLGYFDVNRQSPFEGFVVGGSGMSGYSYYGTDHVSLRGYKDYSLSYRRNGSKMYSKFTVEMRYPVTLKPSATIYALAFLEAGNTNDLFKNYNPFKLYRSAGVGVRIYLPMFGLMGIDWGYGFDEIPWTRDAGKSQFHFVMGQQF